MSAWTPGPWKVEEGSGLVTGPEDGFSVISGCGCCGSPWVEPYDSADSSLANARLIAAAPAMYEALKMLHDETADYVRLNYLGDPHHNRSMQLARAALSAATGETK